MAQNMIFDMPFVQVDAIEDTFTRDMRILDKLVDDLAKGKDIKRIIGE